MLLSSSGVSQTGTARDTALQRRTLPLRTVRATIAQNPRRKCMPTHPVKGRKGSASSVRPGSDPTGRESASPGQRPGHGILHNPAVSRRQFHRAPMDRAIGDSGCALRERGRSGLGSAGSVALGWRGKRARGNLKPPVQLVGGGGGISVFEPRIKDTEGVPSGLGFPSPTP